MCGCTKKFVAVGPKPSATIQQGPKPSATVQMLGAVGQMTQEDPLGLGVTEGCGPGETGIYTGVQGVVTLIACARRPQEWYAD